MWKRWRGKGQKKLRDKIPTREEALDEKIKKIGEVVRKYKEEKEKRLERAKEKKEKYLKRRAKEIKDRDTKAKEEEHWTMLRWLNTYIEENKYQWERRRETLQKEREKIEKEDIKKELEERKCREERIVESREMKKEKANARNRGWKEWREKKIDEDDPERGPVDEEEGVNISPRKIMRGEGGEK